MTSHLKGVKAMGKAAPKKAVLTKVLDNAAKPKAVPATMVKKAPKGVIKTGGGVKAKALNRWSNGVGVGP